MLGIIYIITHSIVCNFTLYIVDFYKSLCAKQKNTENLVLSQDTKSSV